MGNPFLSNVLYPGLSDSRRGFLEAFKTPSKTFRKVGDPMKREVTCLRSSALVAVPAGTFHDTLKNTIAFMNLLISQEFRTERIFAKGVGCVKETQFNASGKITYQLELVTYKIVGDK
jgi:hypothetical protein